mgnify:CR=1 FL=1
MKLYTAEEAAEILSLSKWTVWKYGREGKLKAVRFGRTVRYELEGSHESDESDRKHHRSRDRDGNAHGDRRGNSYSNRGKLGG